MKIAILGAGFAGIATCWHVLQRAPHYQVVVFDPQGIAGGASGTSTGLLHPYPGPRARRAAHATVGMQEASRLLSISSHALGREVYDTAGILRPALSEEQEGHFRAAASNSSTPIWWSEEDLTARSPGITGRGALFIPEALTVDCKLYLEGLWKVCEQKGATLETAAIDSLAAVAHFDRVVVAAGSASAKLPELSYLRLNPVKGQVLDVRWRGTPPSFPTVGKGHLLRGSRHDLFVAGATFEHHFSTEAPVLEVAKEAITKKIAAFCPDFHDAEILGCRAGIRCSTPDHKPLVKQHDDRTWIFTGLGSKGLLWHGYLASILSAKLVPAPTAPSSCAGCFPSLTPSGPH